MGALFVALLPMALPKPAGGCSIQSRHIGNIESLAIAVRLFFYAQNAEKVKRLNAL